MAKCELSRVLGRVAKTMLKRDVKRLDVSLDYEGQSLTVHAYIVWLNSVPVIRLDIKEE